MAGVTGIVRSTCAGGCSRRRRVLRPNHGDLVQSSGMVSFTGCRRDYVHKESKNGAEDYPVYAHRRSGGVRRPWTGFSGEANSDSSLGELHRGVHSLLRGLDEVGKGSIGRSTVAGGSGGRRHAVHGQTPVVLGSGEVERVRRVLGRRRRRHPPLEAFVVVVGPTETRQRAKAPFAPYDIRRRPATRSSHRAASSSTEAHV
jgi:hypothetical protein